MESNQILIEDQMVRKIMSNNWLQYLILGYTKYVLWLKLTLGLNQCEQLYFFIIVDILSTWPQEISPQNIYVLKNFWIHQYLKLVQKIPENHLFTWDHFLNSYKSNIPISIWEELNQISEKQILKENFENQIPKKKFKEILENFSLSILKNHSLIWRNLYFDSSKSQIFHISSPKLLPCPKHLGFQLLYLNSPQAFEFNSKSWIDPRIFIEK